ncbi:hypothetical protein [Halobacteriovorax sp. ZH1_bin.1]|uniref:hypothetical protein n=1 Tax=Halobacteriovorax sp. ZH1_bin.1 TaxID=3157723 RepID=UPI003722513E
MLNFDLENYKRFLDQDDSIILSENILVEQLGKSNCHWIFERKILKEIQGSEIHNQMLELSCELDEEINEYVVFWERGKYILEPVASHLEIIRKDVLPEKVFKLSAEDFVKVIASANGYSYTIPPFKLNQGFHFVGSRKFGQEEVSVLLFTGDPNLDLSRIEEQVKEAKTFYPSHSFIVLVFYNGSIEKKLDEQNFSITAMRNNLLISAQAYFESGIKIQDIMRVVDYPVLIDHQRELLFFFGKKITKQAGSTLYKYLRDFIIHTQSSPMDYANFCSLYCKDKEGEPSRIVGERKKETLKILKKEFKENSDEFQFLNDGLFSYERGFLKSNFDKDDIFEWPNLDFPESFPEFYDVLSAV